MSQRPRMEVCQQARPRGLTSALPTSLGCPRPARICLYPPSTCMCLPKAKVILSPGPAWPECSCQAQCSPLRWGTEAQ